MLVGLLWCGGHGLYLLNDVLFQLEVLLLLGFLLHEEFLPALSDDSHSSLKLSLVGVWLYNVTLGVASIVDIVFQLFVTLLVVHAVEEAFEGLHLVFLWRNAAVGQFLDTFYNLRQCLVALLLRVHHFLLLLYSGLVQHARGAISLPSQSLVWGMGLGCVDVGGEGGMPLSMCATHRQALQLWFVDIRKKKCMPSIRFPCAWRSIRLYESIIGQWGAGCYLCPVLGP